MSPDIQGPAWDLSDEYISFDDPAFAADRAALLAGISRLEARAVACEEALGRAEGLEPAAETGLLETCRECLREAEAAAMLLGNLRVFVGCVLAVQGSDARGKELRGELSSLASRLEVAAAPLELLLVLTPDSFFERLLEDPRAAHHRFRLGQERTLRTRRLGLDEERLLAAMAPDGHTAWGSLYDSLSATIVCEPALPDGTVRMGLSAAASLLRGRDRPAREAAWKAINAAYEMHAESCAASLNAIAGWRLSEYALRSRKEGVHFLDPALHQNRMRASTLEAMMAVVDESVELGRESLALQARLMGLDRLAPWDLLAGAPVIPGVEIPSPLPFEVGLSLVERACGEVDPSMAAFVRGEAAARRIEGRKLAGKRPGAFCTEFPKSRRARVCMTYGGSLSEVSTLAHELGHAYHSSLLADLPLAEADYPMTLAETASTFAEAALGELLAREARGDAELLEVGWSDAQDAATFLLNIPARLRFERRFYELRAERPLGPAALGALMSEAWGRYYGDALASYDELFWCSKLHFYKTGTSFYNFPYTFGYLFSLGVYARREELGEGFHAAYAALLRDTGRMQVEDLAERHLGARLGESGFWRDSVGILRRKIDAFRAIVDRLAPPAGPRGAMPWPNP